MFTALSTSFRSMPFPSYPSTDGDNGLLPLPLSSPLVKEIKTQHRKTSEVTGTKTAIPFEKSMKKVISFSAALSQDDDDDGDEYASESFEVGEHKHTDKDHKHADKEHENADKEQKHTDKANGLSVIQGIVM